MEGIDRGGGGGGGGGRGGLHGAVKSVRSSEWFWLQNQIESIFFFYV